LEEQKNKNKGFQQPEEILEVNEDEEDPNGNN